MSISKDNINLKKDSSSIVVLPIGKSIYEDLREIINQLEAFLEEAKSLPGPFSYVVLGPDYEDDEVDFFWGNFYQSEEARLAFDTEWQKLNPQVEDNWNSVTDCQEPRYYNSGLVPRS